MAPKILATLAFEYLEKERVLITCSGSQAITEDDWCEFVRYASSLAHLGDRVRVLSWTPAHMPTRTQHEALRSATRDSQSRVSIIATGFAVTFIAAALRLTNKNARTFNPTELTASLGHLQLTANEARAVRDALTRLQDRLSGASPADTAARR